MLTSASATSDDGGGEEGGDEEQGGGEEDQGDEPEETTPPEDDDETGTEPDIAADDDQQVPSPETSSLTPGDLFPDSIGPLAPKTPTAPQSLCILNPSDPQCQQKLPITVPTPPTIGVGPYRTCSITPSGFCSPAPPITPSTLCILNPSDPQCRPKTPSPNPTSVPTTIPTIPTPSPTPSPFGALRGGLTQGDQTLQGICILDPNDPRCQSTTPGATTFGSQSPTVDLTRALTPSPTPALGSQLRSLEETPTPTPTQTPAPTPRPIPAPTSLAGPKTPGGSETPRILCVINPSHPDCQPTTPAATLRSQSSALDLTRALNPTSTTGEQVTKAPITPKILCVVNPSHPQCQSTQSSIGNLLPSPSTPDPLLSGPKSRSVGSVPLANPALVPGPDEEGVSQGEPCIAFPCFPYPLWQDEICRNGMDDDFDGKVDETIYCSEVPGESKPKPRTDDVLVPIPGSPLGPPQN